MKNTKKRHILLCWQNNDFFFKKKKKHILNIPMGMKNGSKNNVASSLFGTTYLLHVDCKQCVCYKMEGGGGSGG